MKPKTIILLSGTRCGSTAVYNMFRKHPEVKIPHVNQDVQRLGTNIWESHFWSFVTKPQKLEWFKKRYAECCPFLDIPDDITDIEDRKVFAMWDEIVNHFGPVVFDKSPGFLGNEKAVQLMLDYRDKGNDVVLMSMIRDPFDTITSQYELWGGDIKEREEQWIKKYDHLYGLRDDHPEINLYRYELFSHDPITYGTQMFEKCDLQPYDYCFDHIKPVNEGRWRKSTNRYVQKWKPSKKFMARAELYQYA